MYSTLLRLHLEQLSYGAVTLSLFLNDLAVPCPLDI